MFWALFSKIFYFHMIFHIMQWDCIVDLCNIILHLFFCPYNSLCVVIPSLFCLTKTVHWDSPFTDLNDRVNVTSFECECKLHLTSTYQPNLYYLLNFEALYTSQIINKLIKQYLKISRVNHILWQRLTACCHYLCPICDLQRFLLSHNVCLGFTVNNLSWN